MLGLHQATNTFLDSPAWEPLLGGRWVEGTTWHPPHGAATFRVVARTTLSSPGSGRRSPPTTSSTSSLRVSPDVQVLVVADHDGTAHPVVWVAPGPGRIVYDALGHDVRSYDSPSRVDLFRREVRWLLARLTSAPPRAAPTRTLRGWGRDHPAAAGRSGS